MKQVFSPLPLPQQKTDKPHQDQKHWGNLQGSSDALAIAWAAQQHNGALVVVTADTPSALRLERSIRFFNHAEPIDVTLFPDWKPCPTTPFHPIRISFPSGWRACFA